jgi:4-hydroxy-tetrahydrodipicolinate synthase
MMFHGSMTALITPFRSGNAGEIDWAAFENLVEWQIEQGSHGLVPCGTTGESPTLSDEEIRGLIQACVKISNGRVPVIAGTGSNSTGKTIAMTRMAKECGADAALIVAPYYNKPTQDGLYAHYKTIHNAVELPIVLYNVPGRCVVDIAIDTVVKLAALPRIVALKDATSDVARATLIRPQVKKDFAILSGDDGINGAFLAQGAVGCISVTSNVAPALCAQFQNAWAAGDLKTFQAIQEKLAPLHKAMFCETSPSPVKYACSRLGLCTDDVRLPLLPASASARNIVDGVMESMGLTSVTRSPKRSAHG